MTLHTLALSSGFAKCAAHVLLSSGCAAKCAAMSGESWAGIGSGRNPTVPGCVRALIYDRAVVGLCGVCGRLYGAGCVAGGSGNSAAVSGQSELMYENVLEGREEMAGSEASGCGLNVSCSREVMCAGRGVVGRLVHPREIGLVGERSLNGSSMGENGYSVLYGTGFSAITSNMEGKQLASVPRNTRPSTRCHVPFLRALRFFCQRRYPTTDKMRATAQAMATATIVPVLAPPPCDAALSSCADFALASGLNHTVVVAAVPDILMTDVTGTTEVDVSTVVGSWENVVCVEAIGVNWVSSAVMGAA